MAYPEGFLVLLLFPEVFCLFGGVCSAAWTEVKCLLNTSTLLKDFSVADPEPGQKPHTIVPLK
jgi:hypothetical protein